MFVRQSQIHKTFNIWKFKWLPGSVGSQVASMHVDLLSHLVLALPEIHEYVIIIISAYVLVCGGYESVFSINIQSVALQAA